jgi:4-carboxymuconolactone decarboxylase
MELSTTRQVSEATWQRAKAIFSEQQIVDLISVSGTYAMVAMLLNAAREPAPGATQPLQPLADSR